MARAKHPGVGLARGEAVAADDMVEAIPQPDMAERRLGTAIVVSTAGGDEAVGVFTTTDALRALAALSA